MTCSTVGYAMYKKNTNKNENIHSLKFCNFVDMNDVLYYKEIGSQQLVKSQSVKTTCSKLHTSAYTSLPINYQ